MLQLQNKDSNGVAQIVSNSSINNAAAEDENKHSSPNFHAPVLTKR